MGGVEKPVSLRASEGCVGGGGRIRGQSLRNEWGGGQDKLTLLPPAPKGKLGPRKGIGLTHMPLRRNDARTQGAPFPRGLPQPWCTPGAGTLPVPRLKSSSVALRQAFQEELALPSECWTDTQTMPASHSTATPRSSSAWPSPAVDLSHPEAVTDLIIISILQKKVRLKKLGNLPKAAEKARAWVFEHPDQGLPGGSTGVKRGDARDIVFLESPCASNTGLGEAPTQETLRMPMPCLQSHRPGKGDAGR